MAETLQKCRGVCKAQEVERYDFAMVARTDAERRFQTVSGWKGPKLNKLQVVCRNYTMKIFCTHIPPPNSREEPTWPKLPPEEVIC